MLNTNNASKGNLSMASCYRVTCSDACNWLSGSKNGLDVCFFMNAKLRAVAKGLTLAKKPVADEGFIANYSSPMIVGMRCYIYWCLKHKRMLCFSMP